ncbi:MAG: hypothetical protein OXB84_03065, partial [Halobacteriovoraceae bacterium]|nr:hypothetical protein [Halobacteriovoraceae bacterium]
TALAFLIFNTPIFAEEIICKIRHVLDGIEINQKQIRIPLEKNNNYSPKKETLELGNARLDIYFYSDIKPDIFIIEILARQFWQINESTIFSNWSPKQALHINLDDIYNKSDLFKFRIFPIATIEWGEDVNYTGTCAYHDLDIDDSEEDLDVTMKKIHMKHLYPYYEKAEEFICTQSELSPQSLENNSQIIKYLLDDPQAKVEYREKYEGEEYFKMVTIKPSNLQNPLTIYVIEALEKKEPEDIDEDPEENEETEENNFVNVFLISIGGEKVELNWNQRIRNIPLDLELSDLYLMSHAYNKCSSFNTLTIRNYDPRGRLKSYRIYDRKWYKGVEHRANLSPEVWKKANSFDHINEMAKENPETKKRTVIATINHGIDYNDLTLADKISRTTSKQGKIKIQGHDFENDHPYPYDFHRNPFIVGNSTIMAQIITINNDISLDDDNLEIMPIRTPDNYRPGLMKKMIRFIKNKSDIVFIGVEVTEFFELDLVEQIKKHPDILFIVPSAYYDYKDDDEEEEEDDEDDVKNKPNKKNVDMGPLYTTELPNVIITAHHGDDTTLSEEFISITNNAYFIADTGIIALNDEKDNQQLSNIDPNILAATIMANVAGSIKHEKPKLTPAGIIKKMNKVPLIYNLNKNSFLSSLQDNIFVKSLISMFYQIKNFKLLPSIMRTGNKNETQ